MNTAVRIGLCILITGCLLIAVGCSKKGGQSASTANETVPVADVKAEAAKMNVEQLKAKAMDYKNAIVAKKADIEKVAAKLKAIPVTEQMGTEAKAMQTDMANMNKSVAALTERFQVYYNKLKEMGGSVSGLEM